MAFRRVFSPRVDELIFYLYVYVAMCSEKHAGLFGDQHAAGLRHLTLPVSLGQWGRDRRGSDTAVFLCEHQAPARNPLYFRPHRTTS